MLSTRIQMKPTIYAIINTIGQTLSYRRPTQDGGYTGHIANDAGANWAIYAQGLIEVDTLLTQLKKSPNVPIYQCSCTLASTTYTPTKFTDGFYALLSQKWHIPNQLEASENLKLFQRIAKESGLYAAALTHEPRSFVGQDYLREGDLVNAVVTQFRLAANKPGFIDKEKLRDRERKDDMRMRDNLIKRLIDTHQSDLVSIVTELQYTQPNIPMERIDAEKHFDVCIADFIASPVGESCIGHLWRRHYLDEIGYRTRLELYFSAKQPLDVKAIQVNLSQAFAKATNSLGEVIFGGINDLVSLAHDFACLCEADRYLRLSPHEDYPAQGVSKLPPAAGKIFGTMPHNTMPMITAMPSAVAVSKIGDASLSGYPVRI